MKKISVTFMQIYSLNTDNCFFKCHVKTNTYMHFYIIPLENVCIPILSNTFTSFSKWYALSTFVRKLYKIIERMYNIHEIEMHRWLYTRSYGLIFFPVATHVRLAEKRYGPKTGRCGFDRIRAMSLSVCNYVYEVLSLYWHIWLLCLPVSTCQLNLVLSFALYYF